MASNFNLRGVSSQVMTLLKRQAKEQKTSVNILILKLIEQGIGYSKKSKKIVYHDLDKLAGTWSDQESKTIKKNIRSFEKIDKELWS